MAFCNKERQLISEGFTTLDNKFVLNYVPDAPPKCLAVYLLGLVVSDSDGADNSCTTIAQKLEISEEEVMAAYQYWQELGLVHVTFDTPQQVIYLAVRDSASALKKIKPSKYAKFSREMQNVITGRMISPNEFDEYYVFLESTTFQPEALIAVAKYCVALKGSDINYRYILTVARNQLIKGATTLAVVCDNLDSQQKYDEDLKIVFQALKLKRTFEYTDRERYEKWTKEFGFSLDVIAVVAKKYTSMDKLDAALSEYYKKGALSVAEIENYEQQKEHLTALAKEINRTIGVYYQNVSMVVDEYLVSWISRGYDDETLLAVAKYCFRSGIRTLAGVNSVLDKLYANGVTSTEALEIYLSEAAKRDEDVKSVLAAAGVERNVTNNDRVLYRTWTTKWHMPHDLVCFAATKAAGTASPLAYLNRLLSNYKQACVFTVEQAKEETTATVAANSKKAVLNDIKRAEYTDEQLSALFTALDTEE